MTLTEFEKTVKAMREEQRLYFQTREKAHLKKAKRLERNVDRMLAEKEGCFQGPLLFDK